MKSLSTRTLTLTAMFAAISIILARLLGFYITESQRISFEYFPIILAGICFGPVAGAIVGGVADFMGATVLSGLGFYPPLIVGPILAGLLSGLFAKYALRNGNYSWINVMTVSIIAELLANLLWGSYAVSNLYSIPFFTSLIARAPFKIAIAVVDAQFVYVVLKALRPMLKNYGRA